MSDLDVGNQFDVDPNDITRLAFSWDGMFDEGILLTDAGVMTVSNQSNPDETPVAMTITAGPDLEAGNLSVLFVVAGGTQGHLYKVEHQVETAEAVPQRRNRSFYIQVRDL